MSSMSSPTLITSDSHPLHIDFLTDLPTKGKLGMTFAPGKCQESAPNGETWHRDVETDVKVLKEKHDVDVLVSLLEEHEYKKLSIDNLTEKCQQEGIEVLHLPIADGSTPASVEDTAALVQKIQQRLNAGRNVAVHCSAGFGRTGLITACCLKGLGLPGEEAMTRVREARHGTCERDNHQQYVLNSFPADAELQAQPNA